MQKYRVSKVHRSNIGKYYMHSDPYTDTRIDSIDTGLQDQWQYSPKFKNAIVTTNIALTGSRRKDYKLAEKNTQEVHTPRVTVWHHVWEKDALGNYTMQLVDYNFHQKSCPHAGGCKLWTLENKTAYKSSSAVYVNESLNGKQIGGRKVAKIGRIRSGGQSKDYSDLVIDYIFDSAKEDNRHRAVRLSSHSCKFLVLSLWGLDPYGNEFWKDQKGNLYFYDHEAGKCASLGLHENSILR